MLPCNEVDRVLRFDPLRKQADFQLVHERKKLVKRFVIWESKRTILVGVHPKPYVFYGVSLIGTM